MDTKLLIISFAVIVIGFIILFGRRVRAQYGSTRPNGKVTDRFESYDMKPDLVYYYSGTETVPTAIIGVDRQLTLDSKLWKRVDITPEKLKTLVQNMKAQVSERDETLHGFDILDNRGMFIGEWFSVLGIHTVIKMGKDNKITIHPPPIDIYREEK
jgi:hypothetical protein